jgi:hypothetical protein
VARRRLSPATRLAVWASIFLAGLILAVAFPIQRGATQTLEPAPTPDPLPDPNPAQPPGGGAVGSSGGSHGGSADGSATPAASDGAGGQRSVPSDHGRQAKTSIRERPATRAAKETRHVQAPRRIQGDFLTPQLVTRGGASPSLLYLEVLLLALAGALALMLTLTIRVSSNRLAGLSDGLAEQRGHAAALIAVLLLAVMVGLLVVHLVGQA